MAWCLRAVNRSIREPIPDLNGFSSGLAERSDPGLRCAIARHVALADDVEERGSVAPELTG
jgi:hypothetical protein